MAQAPTSTQGTPPEAVSGVMLAKGIGAREPQGFWAEAWSQVVKQPIAVSSILWIAVVGLLSVFAPLIANGHPITMLALDPTTGAWVREWPLFVNLKTGDWLLLIWAIASIAVLLVPNAAGRATRLGIIVASGLQLTFITVMLAWVVGSFRERDASDWMRNLEQDDAFPLVVSIGVPLLVSAVFLLMPTLQTLYKRLALVSIVGALGGGVAFATFSPSPELFDYQQRIGFGTAKEPIYTLIPWSPTQQFGDRNADRLPPGSSETGALASAIVTNLPPAEPIGEEGIAFILDRIGDVPLNDEQRAIVLETLDSNPLSAETTGFEAEQELKRILTPLGKRFLLGTDGKGQDVLSQLIHAARLAISIGLVSTGIAVVIGVTLGALMGYFGGVVDMLLYRVVEIFMAVPVLFILIVTAGLLKERNTYVMMAIIGCFTWHSAARFVRAEFFKLRDQDFVQSAKAVGLPLRSILFKHMLPNGVTPVLVDASFAIALAIHFEATLSFLGLGPQDQASWGGMLADSTGDSGDFKWWLAVFPGGAIFLTALAYNLMGEALRDAIDPKLKKARV